MTGALFDSRWKGGQHGGQLNGPALQKKVRTSEKTHIFNDKD